MAGDVLDVLLRGLSQSSDPLIRRWAERLRAGERAKIKTQQATK
jgi:hypothetical protein